MSKTNNDTSIVSRNAALKILLSVLKDGQSLNTLSHLTDNMEARDAGFARMLSFGVLRFYFQLLEQLNPFLKKKLKTKDLDVQLTLMVALYQILHTRVPDYAVVDAAVTQTRKSKKKWAAGMVNAVLRNFIRQHEIKNEAEDAQVSEANEKIKPTFKTEEAEYAHPQWMIDRIKQDWPDVWKDILLANNVQAPMTLRINQQKTGLENYKETLQNEYDLSAETVNFAAHALLLNEARDVTQLPGFDLGWVSVQDAGAQLAAIILQPAQGDKILDACAAPGGKTAHLFEIQPDICLTALDISEPRLERVRENCERLGFKPEIITGDAVAVEEWWEGEPFDKILLDVPCSASDVIRRHPDIKHLRWEEDINELVELQRKILMKNWALLKPGGRLLYATCSIFKAENEEQIEWFTTQVDDAHLVDIEEWALPVKATEIESEKMPQASAGKQLFPVNFKNDGFYYALIEKK